MQIFNAGFRQRLGELTLIEVRIAAGAWKASDIHQGLNPMLT
jgi:hypothetical protein